MSLHWNVIKVRTGMELTAHELLAHMGYEVYTPFIDRRQRVRLTKKQLALLQRGGRKAKSIQTHIHYADPILSGWLLIRFDGSDAMTHTLFATMERKPYLYGALMDGEGLYGIRAASVDAYRETLTGLYKAAERREAKPEFRRLKVRGYDPRQDARKNRNKKYAQKELVIPEFEIGEKVEFLSGAWANLKLQVTEYSAELVRLEGDLFGRVAKLQAQAIDLRKAG